MFIDVSQPPLDHRLVRLAMHYAINRQAIVHELWHGRSVVPNDAYPRIGMVGDDPKKPRFEYHPRKARELFTEAGYAGEEMTIEGVKSDLTQEVKLAETIAVMFRKVGINAIG